MSSPINVTILKRRDYPGKEIILVRNDIALVSLSVMGGHTLGRYFCSISSCRGQPVRRLSSRACQWGGCWRDNQWWHCPGVALSRWVSGCWGKIFLGICGCWWTASDEIVLLNIVGTGVAMGAQLVMALSWWVSRCSDDSRWGGDCPSESLDAVNIYDGHYLTSLVVSLCDECFRCQLLNVCDEIIHIL